MNIQLRFLSATFLFATISATASAQVPTLKDIPAPDPELEKATCKVPEGFEVNLFAADPSIAKPIQMNFDEDGRLWIASSEVYPQIVPGAPATDRVVVDEDLNHDGAADKTTACSAHLLQRRFNPDGAAADRVGSHQQKLMRKAVFDPVTARLRGRSEDRSAYVARPVLRPGSIASTKAVAKGRFRSRSSETARKHEMG